MDMNEICRRLANKHGVSEKEVMEEMRQALEWAYTNPEADEFSKFSQSLVPRAGAIPTPEEFIRFAAKKSKQKK